MSRSRAVAPATRTLAPLAFLAATLAAAWPATADPLPAAGASRTALNFPNRHPYLLLTPAEVESARARATRNTADQARLEAVVRDAREIASRPRKPLPEPGDTAHWQVAEELIRAGIGHAFGQDPNVAAWAAQGLLAYADLYASLPVNKRHCRMFHQSSLYEAMWVEKIALAYDLVADSGALTPAQRQRIETGLLRQTVPSFQITEPGRDPRLRDLHFRCYNFQAWHLGAIGLTGLALRDPELVDWAINSRYGFRHLVAHDIRDDGLFWERSPGYHQFVISALLPFTEALLRCGADLYAAQIPADRASIEGCHYPTDSSIVPKSFGMMFQAPLYLAFPDLSYAALGDSDRGPLGAGWTSLIAWNRYPKPCLAWLLRRQMGPAARTGFLHYYRYRYRYEDLRLNGKPVRWERRDATYDFKGERFEASDQGVQQADHYLLNGEDLSDFVLEWSMTRLEDFGNDERAWVVFQCNPRAPAERRCFSLAGRIAKLGHPVRFRLEVRGDQARLEQEGKLVSTNPVAYHDTADWHRLIYSAPSVEPAQEAADQAATWSDQSVGNSGEFRNGCTLLPSSGVAVLRSQPGDITADLSATAVALSYGPYGGGHGHPDKLGIVVAAQGRQWIPNYGSMPYETHWKREWTSHTVSHNTLVIDGVSQQPSGSEDKMWPCDTADQHIQGALERFDPAARIVAARCNSAYPGWSLRREIRLWNRCVVDRFDADPDPGAPAKSGSPHEFDYVLHVDGEFEESNVPLAPLASPLGMRCGYQLIDHPQSATAQQPVRLTFASGSNRLRIWIVPQQAPVQIICGKSPTNSPEERKPLLIVRQTGDQARFFSVIEPVTGTPLEEKAVCKLLPSP